MVLSLESLEANAFDGSELIIDATDRRVVGQSVQTRPSSVAASLQSAGKVLAALTGSYHSARFLQGARAFLSGE